MKKSHRTGIILISILFSVLLITASFAKLQHYHPKITIALYAAAAVVFIFELIYIYMVLSRLK